jgi:hypothetical protein
MGWFGGGRVRSLAIPGFYGDGLLGEGAELGLSAPRGLLGGMLEWNRASGLAPGKRQQASAVQGLRRAEGI